jgi:CMP-N,N'-diacetyllegionaminic acid synthase
VPARGGSKRLPGKNILDFAGRPLIAWTTLAAAGLEGIADVLVSTDDADIGAAGAEAGALVPWLRPPHLATDTASSLDVALHALDWYEAIHGAVDGLLLLQPTSPLRQRGTIEKALAMFARGRRAVVGVVPAPVSPQWCMKIADGVLVPYLDNAGLTSRSQDLDPAYVPNGAIYLLAPEALRRHRTFFPQGTVPLVMSAEESVDIDTELDFRFAEWMARQASCDA